MTHDDDVDIIQDNEGLGGNNRKSKEKKNLFSHMINCFSAES